MGEGKSHLRDPPRWWGQTLEDWIRITWAFCLFCFPCKYATFPCFPGGAVVKNTPANAGDLRDPVSIPRLERFPGERHGNPFQYFCLGNSMDRGARWATVQWVAKSQTRLKRLSRHTCTQALNKYLLKMDIVLPKMFWRKVFKCKKLFDTSVKREIKLNYSWNAI